MSSTDETKAVLDFLAAQTALKEIQFWGAVDVPPAGYKPANGIGVCLKVRGGVDNDPDVLISPSFQLKIYGPNEMDCLTAARLIHDNLQDQADANILMAQRESLPIPLKEPDVEWNYALTFYKIMIRNLN